MPSKSASLDKIRGVTTRYQKPGKETRPQPRRRNTNGASDGTQALATIVACSRFSTPSKEDIYTYTKTSRKRRARYLCRLIRARSASDSSFSDDTCRLWPPLFVHAAMATRQLSTCSQCVRTPRSTKLRAFDMHSYEEVANGLSEVKAGIAASMAEALLQIDWFNDFRVA